MAVQFGYRPSNGTDGAYFTAQTCARCTVDHDTGWHSPPHFEGDESCPILLSTLCGPYDYPNEGPPEWGHDYETGESVCSGFRGPCECDEDA